MMMDSFSLLRKRGVDIGSIAYEHWLVFCTSVGELARNLLAGAVTDGTCVAYMTAHCLGL
jgi:hypothetical protein